MSNDTNWVVIGLALVAIWIIGDTVRNRDKQTTYVIVGQDCDDQATCSKFTFQSTTFAIDRQNREVVWRQDDTEELGHFDSCIIFDAENWGCGPDFVMKDGFFQRTDMDRVGHVYRVSWLKWLGLDFFSHLGMRAAEISRR